MEEMKTRSFKSGHTANRFDVVIFLSIDAAGIADTCSFDQARGRGADAGHSSLLLGPIGLA